LACKKGIQTVSYADEEITAEEDRHVKYWTSQMKVHENLWKKYSKIKTQILINQRTTVRMFKK
jgi:hypothetical protein